LLDKSARSRREVLLWNDDLGCLHPMRGGDALSCECLDILDGVFGSIVEELANDLDCLIVGDVDGGFRATGFPMQILSIRLSVDSGEDAGRYPRERPRLRRR
jgi:hypothetical protein